MEIGYLPVCFNWQTWVIGHKKEKTPLVSGKCH